MLFSLTTSQNLLWKLRVKMTHLKHLAHIKTEFNPHVMKELVTGSTSLIKISVMMAIFFYFIRNSLLDYYKILPIFS